MPKDISFISLIDAIMEIDKYKKDNKNNNVVKKYETDNIYNYDSIVNMVKNSPNLVDKIKYIRLYETSIYKGDYKLEFELLKKEGYLFNLIPEDLFDERFIFNSYGILTPQESIITYRNFNNLEIKRYFTWRKKVLNGIFIYPTPKFIYLFVSEIYNDIITKDPIEGFELLMFIYNELYKLNSHNEKVFSPYIFGYIYLKDINLNNIYSKEAFNKLLNITDLDKLSINDKINKYILNELNNSEYINKLSINSDLEFDEELNNKIIKLYKNIFNRINNYLIDNNIKVSNLYFKELPYYYQYNINLVSDYNIKNNNVIYKNIENFNIEFGCIYSNYYLCYTKYYIYKELLTSHFYNYIELNIYNKLLNKNKDYQSYINKFPVILNNHLIFGLNIIINEEIKKYNESLNEFEIDLSKINKIKKVSDEVSSKLITDSLEEEIKEVIIESNDTINYRELVNRINNNELYIYLIKSILNNSSLNEIVNYINKNNKMIEVLIEEINELSNEYIFDNLIEYEEFSYIKIYEDYIDEIRKLIGE